jgi:GGDEF domain-containing protein
MPRVSNTPGVLILAAALPALAVALHAVAGPLVAAVVCSVYAAALALTMRAERDGDTPSRDALTGLPDRAAALDRLEKIFGQRLAGSSQAAVFVISIDASDIRQTDSQSVIFMATVRLAQGLRRGDQIIRIGDHALAAVLGPSRGLTEPAAESILDRINGMFREPMVAGSHVIAVRVSVGACLQHDAPRADAPSWLEAAELAATLAAEDGEPRLFPSGATKVDRSAWDDINRYSQVDSPDENLWSAVAAGRADDVAPATHNRKRESA